MASTYRFYMAVTLGDGLSIATAYRSKLANYIVGNATQDFWSWANDTHSVQFCLAWCDPELHTTIAADADIVPISAQLADLSAITTYLDTPIASIPSGVQAALEANGIPVDWIVMGTTTPRTFWRFIAARHFITQKLADNPNALQFLRANLDSVVSTLTIAQRNAVGNWMISRDIDTSWIVGSTTVRQVLKFIINNGNFQTLSYGPVTF